MRDLKSNIDAATILASADHAATGQTSSTVDLQLFNSVAIVLEVGTITGAGTVIPKLQESDDDSVWTDVNVNEVVAGFEALVSGVNQKVSYNGIKRYIRVVTTIGATITAATYGALAVKGNPLEGAV